MNARPVFTWIHRCVGLFIAAFIFFSGITGAVISWDHELDDLINPGLMHAAGTGTPLSAIELVGRVEQRHPQVRAGHFPLRAEPGDSFPVFVIPRVDPATGRLFEPGFNQVFLNPFTGDELGRRQWGAVWPISKENFVSFLYRLHYTLHLPAFWGRDRWGHWLLGAIALLWAVDCFVGLYLTLPARRRASDATEDRSDVVPPAARSWWRRWRPAWKVRWKGGPARLTFDLHRAFSLWTWLVLFTIAFTGFSLNLYREIVQPVMSTMSRPSPTPFDQRKPTARHEPIDPAIGWQKVIEVGRAEGARRGWPPLGPVTYSERFGIHHGLFFDSGDDHGVGGVGPIRLFIDGMTAEVLGQRLPWNGTAADIFVQSLFPLHSGRILGMPGRVMTSAMGIVAATLSVTGVMIWWRKRRARKLAAATV